MVSEKPEEHFLTVLHSHSADASIISEALVSILQQKLLDLRKLTGQGYDGAITFAGKISGVHKQIQTSSAHVIYIYCSCHRLQLTSIQAAASVKEIRMLFGSITSIWNLFYYSPQIQMHWRVFRLFLVFPSWRLWSQALMCIKQLLPIRSCQCPSSLKLVHAEEDSWLQQASLYAQEYTWPSKFQQGEWCQLVDCSWDSHIELRKAWNYKPRIIGNQQ